MNVRPAGREACECASPINQILERLDQMDADIASAQQAANTAVGTATAQAGAAAASAASAQADAAAALINAGAAQDAADDAHDEAVAAAGSAQDAADDAADALLALQNIESTIASVLATDLGGKVDKLTTAGLHLYSHNGSSQGEVAPDINPTAATIPIRDSNGYLYGETNTTGTRDKVLATGTRVQNDLDAYAPMVRTSGNQTITGIKTFSSGLYTAGSSNNKRVDIQSNEIVYNETPSSTQNSPLVAFTDKNGGWLSYLFVQRRTSGKSAVVLWVRNTDGTNKQITLIEADN